MSDRCTKHCECKARWETAFATADADLAAIRTRLEGAEKRVYKLRLALFQMRDAREVTSAAGFTLTKEAKAKLYDIQQDIIRAAIAADDAFLAPTPPEPPRPLAGRVARHLEDVDERCAECGGTGLMCRTCNGTGRTPEVTR